MSLKTMRSFLSSSIVTITINTSFPLGLIATALHLTASDRSHLKRKRVLSPESSDSSYSSNSESLLARFSRIRNESDPNSNSTYAADTDSDPNSDDALSDSDESFHSVISVNSKDGLFFTEECCSFESDSDLDGYDGDITNRLENLNIDNNRSLDTAVTDNKPNSTSSSTSSPVEHDNDNHDNHIEFQESESEDPIKVTVLSEEFQPDPALVNLEPDSEPVTTVQEPELRVNTTIVQPASTTAALPTLSPSPSEVQKLKDSNDRYYKSMETITAPEEITGYKKICDIPKSDLWYRGAAIRDDNSDYMKQYRELCSQSIKTRSDKIYIGGRWI